MTDRIAEIEARTKRHCNTCIRDDGGTCHHPGLDASADGELCLDSNEFPYWSGGADTDELAELRAMALSLAEAIEKHRGNVWGGGAVKHDEDITLYAALSDARLIRLKGGV